MIRPDRGQQKRTLPHIRSRPTIRQIRCSNGLLEVLQSTFGIVIPIRAMREVMVTSRWCSRAPSSLPSANPAILESSLCKKPGSTLRKYLMTTRSFRKNNGYPQVRLDAIGHCARKLACSDLIWLRLGARGSGRHVLPAHSNIPRPRQLNAACSPACCSQQNTCEGLCDDRHHRITRTIWLNHTAADCPPKSHHERLGQDLRSQYGLASVTVAMAVRKLPTKPHQRSP